MRRGGGAPGDYVFGDVDGVVVIPAAVATAVVAQAFAKVEGENTARDELAGGLKLADVYAKYGVL
jgi:4-hydroxy-4-methyl-2-oxoglutarate aldolase